MDQNKYWEFIKQIYRWTPDTKEFEVYGISEPANRSLYTLTEPKLGQQKLEVFNWFTGTSKVVAENLDALIPELAEEGVVMELIAEPIYPDSAMRYAFFQAKNPTTELQPATNFYKFDKVTGVINRMKISTLLPANTENMVVNNTENKLAWSPIKSNGLARELYVFDLIKDTRTLVKTLPTNQTFYKNTEDLRNFSSDFEWFDDKTIGYQTRRRIAALLREAAGCAGKVDGGGIPVSLRTPGDASQSNQATMMLVSLGTHLADPKKRFAAMLKSSQNAKVLTGTMKSVVPTDLPSLGIPWIMSIVTPLYKMAVRVQPHSRHRQCRDLQCAGSADGVVCGGRGNSRVLPRLHR